MASATLKELARHLNLTDRRVRQLVDEGVIRQLADGRFDLRECQRHYRIFSRRDELDIERLERDVVDLAQAAEDGIRDLAELPMEDRQAAAGPVGALIGKLTASLDLLAALQRQGAVRDFHRGYVSMISATFMRQLLAVLGLEIADEAEAA